MSVRREDFREFLGRFGWAGAARLPLYPLTALATTPVRLVQALAAAVRTPVSEWRWIPHFNPHAALNHLFYWTAAVNLSRHGLAGESPFLGTGRFPMAKFFYYCRPSLLVYQRLGGLAVLLAMLAWWVSHAIWAFQADGGHVAAVMLLALCSTTFYANTFGTQNYNALGWAFFPVGLYASLSGHFWLAAAAWLLAGFASITVVLMAAMISTAVWAVFGTVGAVYAVAPALLKLAFHLRVFLRKKGILSALRDMIGAIGLAEQKVAYRRTTSKSFGARKLYYALLYLQFLFVVSLESDAMACLFGAAALIFILNACVFRFADEQSAVLFVAGVGTAAVMMLHGWLPMVSYWLLISPLPLFAGFPSCGRVLDVVPKLRPFSIRKLQEEMSRFLAPVAEGERVLMAFDSPQGVYEKIFDGYRVLLELPLYVAAVKKIHFMPDWWGVFSLNRENAPHFWGRAPESVRQNALRWEAHFVVVYQEAGTPLDPGWQTAGFHPVSQFSWKGADRELGGFQPYAGVTPEWWLLKS